MLIDILGLYKEENLYTCKDAWDEVGILFVNGLYSVVFSESGDNSE